MKRYSFIVILLSAAIVLTSCKSKTETTAVPEVAAPAVKVDTISTPIVGEQPQDPSNPSIDYTFESALSTRLLLALGSLKLAETAAPITKDQAAQMMMLWQALENLSSSGTSPEAEVNALLTQVEEALTAEQIAAINAMQLTQEDLQAWTETNGIVVGSGTGAGSGTGQGMGQGSGLSPEARATKQAENALLGMTPSEEGGQGGISSAITQALIEYLGNIN